MKKSACYEVSNLPTWNTAEYRSKVAAILKTKMAAKIWMCQLASIKILIEQYLNYLCAKIYNFIQKCTPIYRRAHTAKHCPKEEKQS